MDKTIKADLCVIGAGSGGLSVAAAAIAFGASVILIEKHKMGGDCLNYGCVPSKALIAAAKIAHVGNKSEVFGVSYTKPKVNYAKVQAHIKDIIAQIAPHDSVERFEGLGVNVIKGSAQFLDTNSVIVNNQIIKARRFIIATGARTFIPKINGLDKIKYLTNESIFELKTLPKHLIIIGAGAIGMEMAQAYSRLGAKISVIEKFNALNNYDEELTNIALKAIQNDGVKIYENSEILSIEKIDKEINVTIKNSKSSKTIKGSHILLATGKTANIKELQLKKANVELENNHIKINSALRTSNKKIFAIGDVTGGLQLTPNASYQASLIVRNALFALPIKTNDAIIPIVTYIDPEIASVGLSETEAKKRYGKKIKIIYSNFKQNDKAIIMRKTDGLIKLIIKNNGKIIGCSIVGENAGELISLFSFALANKQKAIALASFIAPYPTLSEIGKRVGIESFRAKLSSPLIKIWVSLIRRF